MFILGWGKDRVFSSVSHMYNETEKPSKYLKKIGVPLLSSDECVQYLNSTNKTVTDSNMFWNKMMCGGSEDPSLGKASFTLVGDLYY